MSMCDEFHLKKIFDVRAVFLEKYISRSQVYPFLCHLYYDGDLSLDVNRLSYDKHKTTSMNLKMEAFCLPFVFCYGQRYLKTSGPNVTS